MATPSHCLSCMVSAAAAEAWWRSRSGEVDDRVIECCSQSVVYTTQQWFGCCRPKINDYSHMCQLYNHACRQSGLRLCVLHN